MTAPDRWTDPALIMRLDRELAAHPAIDDRERASVRLTRERLRERAPFDATARLDHLTASALVVSRAGVVLHQHRRLGRWLQPGGHVEPGESPIAAAVREVREETGLVAAPVSEVIFHVDRHPGPRQHLHFDLRYVLVTTPASFSPAEGESREVAWFSFEDAIGVADDDGLRSALTELASRVAAGFVEHWPRE